MKGKRRRKNPLSEYRRIQREIREIFDPFTARHCPTCSTPCCIKPTRCTPVDVALAVSTGHAFPHLGDVDPYAPALSHAGHRLGAPIPLPMAQEAPDTLVPCEYLHEYRCTFPSDLRPYGCTTYLCKPMYKHLPDETIAKLRRLIRQLDEAHESLLAALRDAGTYPEDRED